MAKKFRSTKLRNITLFVCIFQVIWHISTIKCVEISIKHTTWKKIFKKYKKHKAHWCPPCRAFTPKLKECYEKWKKAGESVEIIFCSSDRGQSDFDSYFKEHGSWLALPFGDERKDKLSVLINH